jgi:hypothetical protein
LVIAHLREAVKMLVFVLRTMLVWSRKEEEDTECPFEQTQGLSSGLVVSAQNDLVDRKEHCLWQRANSSEHS